MFSKEIKTIKLLQDGAREIEASHAQISDGLRSARDALLALEMSGGDVPPAFIFTTSNSKKENTPLRKVGFDEISREAEAKYRGRVGLNDILTREDFFAIEKRIGDHTKDFNRRYSLDAWDYAIAGGCGLFAAMLDILCVRKPLRPTQKYEEGVDGVFNKAAQKAFNFFLPADFSSELSKKFPVWSADTPTKDGFLGATTINPTNHRLRSLAHDPVCGFIFGALDIIKGTCTVVEGGKVMCLPTTQQSKDMNIFRAMGQMFGHLLSDVNAPTAIGNRGMGIPAPFMGLLRMFDKIKVGDSTFDKQIEFMFVRGYDFRQFVTSAIPTTIMEVMLRVFYAGKQVSEYGADFGETMMDTVPMRMNPRFRMILALAYGTSSAVNLGKVYVTGDILNLNYASWLGLTWNTFFSLKWALFDKHTKFWDEFEAKEIAEIEAISQKLDGLMERAAKLPI